MEKQKDDKSLKKTFYKKWWFWVLVILFVIIVGVSSEESSSNKNEPVNEVEKAEINNEEKELSESEKNELQEFYRQVISTTKRADEEYEKWANNLEKVPVYESYLKADDIIASNTDVRNKLNNIKIPDVNIEKTDKSKLKDAINNLRTGYYTKNNALKSAQKYLNNNDLKALSSFKSDISMAQSFMNDAIIGIVSVFIEYSVDIPE